MEAGLIELDDAPRRDEPDAVLRHADVDALAVVGVVVGREHGHTSVIADHDLRSALARRDDNGPVGEVVANVFPNDGRDHRLPRACSMPTGMET